MSKPPSEVLIPKPFRKAIEFNDFGVINKLLKETDLNVEALKFLLDWSYKVLTKINDTELEEFFDIVTDLVARIVAITAEHEIPELLATYCHDRLVFDWLLENEKIKKHAASNDNYAITIAAKQGAIEAVKLLLAIREVRENSEGLLQAFSLAAKNGHLQVMKELLTIESVQKKLLTPYYIENVHSENDLDILRDIINEGKIEVLKEVLTWLEDKCILDEEMFSDKIFDLIGAYSMQLELLNTEENLSQQTKKGDQENLKKKEEFLSLDATSQKQLLSIEPKKYLNILYESYIPTLTKNIFIEGRGDERHLILDIINPNEDITVIHNNEGYLTTTSSEVENNEINGLRLFLDDAKQIPIGYNIHLPQQGNEIKNVLINVYGGSSVSSNSRLHLPEELEVLDIYLMNHGTAVITLNLPDVLKLDTIQGQMSEDLHEEIHACINKFYETLKATPEALHSILNQYQLSEKKYFLYGESFGGRTAIRHAELYPHTFAGYISHDGALSSEIAEKSDFLNRKPLKKHLNPSQKDEMKKIVDPVLLMHNLDDNNVNVLVSLDFYKQLLKLGKFDLARICITPNGNSIEDSDIKNKGHYVTENKDFFVRYAETLRHFMENGPSAVSALDEWQAYRSEQIANKFYKSGTLQQKFIAEILHQQRFNARERDKMKEFKQQDADRVWDFHYKPLFYAMYQVRQMGEDDDILKKEVHRLEKNKLLSDDNIKNALRFQSHVFIEYVKERYDIKISADDLVNNQEIIRFFRDSINSLATETSKTAIAEKLPLLSALYQANPHILSSQYPCFEKDPAVQQALNEAKEGLNTTLRQHRKLIAYAWRQAAKVSQKQENNTVNKVIKDNKDTVSKKFVRDNRK